MSDANAADAVLAEFRQVLNDLAGTHNAALWGLRLLREFLVSLPTVPGADPDASLLVGEGDPGAAGGALAYMSWPIKSLPERLADDGPVAEQLGQQWLVLVCTECEDHYRQQIADAAGVTKNDVKFPVMGDVSKMRNDVVHHRGVATKGNSGRCEVLTWFKPGDRMLIPQARVREFMEQLGLTWRFT